MRKLCWERAVLIGQGACARVYRVEDTEGKVYACKISERAALLRKEADILRQVRGESAVLFYDYWESDGRGYLLIEYIAGENLDVYLKKHGRLKESQAVAIGIAVADALTGLQAGGETVVFRDIKPENILLCENGDIRLVDFGCLCGPGRNTEIAGTVGFAAPEQFKLNAEIGGFSDVYGLASTLRVLLGFGGSRRIRRLLDRCTLQEGQLRIPNLRVLGRLLEHLLKPRCTLTETEKAYGMGDLILVKNIWEKD